MTGVLVLLDWDGTVADSRENLLDCWYEATAAVLGRRFPETEEDLAWIFRTRYAEIFAEITQDASQAAELSRAFDDAYRRQQIRPFPGMREALETLASAGAKLGVVTSKTRQRLLHDLSSAEFGSIFTVMVTGDDVRRAKPDPEGVLAAARHVGTEPACSVMVGDTEADLFAARGAGMPAVVVAWGYGGLSALAAADCFCESPADLPRVIGRLAGDRLGSL